MPGINGIITRDCRERYASDLIRMNECMMHEKFYRNGSYIDEKHGLFLGWVCAKHSFADLMQIIDEKKGIILLFSGENFSEKTLINDTKGKSCGYDSANGDYLVGLYEKRDVEFLKYLNGWFSGVLFDINQGKIILFNDRYGMGRIYYHEDKDEFIFSSEAKAILRVRPQLRRINSRRLGEFFVCGCTLNNRSLFEDIFILPGGSAWIFQNGGEIKKYKYFSPSEWENQSCLEGEIFFQVLKEKLPNIISRYFREEERIGISLTGGLDTRIILACRGNIPGPLPCYSFASPYRDSFDVRISGRIAATIKQEHYVLRIGKDFFDDFGALAEKCAYISDGTIDLSGVPELYMNRLAGEIAPIRMTGNYGGEVLRRVRSFRPEILCDDIFGLEFKKEMDEARSSFKEISGGHPLSFVTFRQAPWLGHGRLSIEQSQVTVRTPYMDNDLVKLLYQAPGGVCDSNEVSIRLVCENNPALALILTDRGVGIRGKVQSSLFWRLYCELTFKAEYYYDYGMPQWAAKIDNILAPLYLGKFLLGRHKFYHFRKWFRDELGDYVKAILFDNRTQSRAYLNKKYLKEMAERHTRREGNYTNEINKIITAELIHRTFVD